MIISWPDDPPHIAPGISRPGITSLPDSVLERHGAGILQPAVAVRRPGDPVFSPTAYRTSVLLVRNDFFRQPDRIVDINEALGTIGLRIEGMSGFNDDLPAFIPRPVNLVADTTDPVQVDAWLALQTLRAHGVDEGVSLDHLLVGSATTGVGLGVVEGVPGMGNGTATRPTGDWTTSDYRLRPVAVAMALPPRRIEQDLPGQRRAVVAVLDTGIDDNTPLGIAVRGQDRANWVRGDVVVTDDKVRQIVRTSGEILRAGYPARGIEPITDERDAPGTAQPLVGEIDTHTGHGTFITGIIRQAAPDARVLAIRVLHSDGIGYQSDALAALGAILERVKTAQTGDPTKMVDVISLSWGYYDESPEFHAPELAKVIRKLRRRGVIVAAAAGNFASDRPFLPAALATYQANPAKPVPVIGVGALNPNGSKAIFSNEGSWVTCWATGCAVISTYPDRVNASHNPSLQVAAVNGATLPQSRQSADADDFTSGFAMWHGTSFAAPFVAARIAARLQEVDLSDVSRQTARRRAWDAVQAEKAHWQPVP